MTEALVVEGLSKRFGAVEALKDVGLRVQAGEIHALVGGNGAGKSTLVKILAGSVRPDAGRLAVGGLELRPGSPLLSRRAGVVTVFQELALIPDLSVAENLLDGHEPRTAAGTLDFRRMWSLARDLLARFDLGDVDPRQPVRTLTLDRQQLLEIARAFAFPGRLMLLDEPTSALSHNEAERFFAWLSEYRTGGGSALIISHRLGEIETMADRGTVLRDGQAVGEFQVGERSWDEVIALMVGRRLGELFPAKAITTAAEPVLTVRDLEAPGVHAVDLDVYPGEIFGIAGLEGQGQVQLLYALFGALPIVRGEVRVAGTPRRLSTPRDALTAGIGLVPLDRRSEGLHPARSIQDNLSLPTLPRRAGPLGWIRARDEQRMARAVVDTLHVRAASLTLPVASLSGGNQQKVAIGRWLPAEPSILLLADPTRGVDLATKQDLYALMRHWADEGRAVVLYSTDLSEVVGLCQRVAVMYEGHLQALLQGEQIREEAILHHSHGLATSA